MSDVIFFPDNENFKNRNFPMIHRLLRDFGMQALFDTPPKKNINLFLRGRRRNFVETALANRFLYNIDIFEVIGAEYRRYINSRSLSENLPFKWADILNEKLDALDKMALRELLQNINDAHLCIEYYREKLFVKRPFLVFVFGGSKIYQRACLKVCEIYNLNTFVLEHFFTGNHVYIEPQFSQIQNNSSTIERVYARAKKEDGNLFPAKLMLFNKNVKEQPNIALVDEILEAKEDKKLGCVFLQVFDDYSLANISDDFVLSDEIDDVIQTALQENECVLLKLHPFEYTKHSAYPTRDYIEKKFWNEIQIGRVIFVEGMEEEQFLRIENWYGIVSQFSLNLTLIGLSSRNNHAFFFEGLFRGLREDEKILLLHRITEHGLFENSERSYKRFVEHISSNLLPSIGCSENELVKFNDKLHFVKKAQKIIKTPPPSHRADNSGLLWGTKTRNAIRLLFVDPHAFRAKLLAKLRF